MNDRTEKALSLLREALRVLDPDQNAVTWKIVQDEFAYSPDEWGDEECFLVGFHRDFNVIRKGLERAEDIEDWKDEYHVLPLFAYIHSGVSLSTGPYTCKWDSGQVGYILCRKDLFSEEKAAGAADALCEEWNTYLSGDVWAYEVVDIHGDIVESLCGIYSRETAEKEAKEMARLVNEKRGFIVESVEA